MKLSIREITQIGMFSALTAIGAFISVPIGPVPITLQSFFVILSGILLGSKNAMLSQVIYLILGLIGLPIFAGFTGGLQTIFKPSFGFIIGYIVAAYFTGKIVENYKNIKSLPFAVLIGTIIIYAIGLPYMYYILNIMLAKNFTIMQILQMGMLAFIPGDTLKAMVAVFVGNRLYNRLFATNQTRKQF